MRRRSSASMESIRTILPKIVMSAKAALLCCCLPLTGLYSFLGTFLLVTYKVCKIWPVATSTASWKYLVQLRETFVIDPHCNATPSVVQEAGLVTPDVSFIHLILFTVCSYLSLILCIMLGIASCQKVPDFELVKWISKIMLFVSIVNLAVDTSYAVHFLVDRHTLGSFMDGSTFSSDDLYSLDMSRLAAALGAFLAVKGIALYILYFLLQIFYLWTIHQYQKVINEEAHPIHKRGILEAYRNSWRRKRPRTDDDFELSDIPTPPPPAVPRNRRSHLIEAQIPSVSASVSSQVVRPRELRRVSRRGLSVTEIPELTSPSPSPDEVTTTCFFESERCPRRSRDKGLKAISADSAPARVLPPYPSSSNINDGRPVERVRDTGLRSISADSAPARVLPPYPPGSYIDYGRPVNRIRGTGVRSIAADSAPARVLPPYPSPNYIDDGRPVERVRDTGLRSIPADSAPARVLPQYITPSFADDEDEIIVERVRDTGRRSMSNRSAPSRVPPQYITPSFVDDEDEIIVERVRDTGRRSVSNRSAPPRVLPQYITPSFVDDEDEIIVERVRDTGRSSVSNRSAPPRVLPAYTFQSRKITPIAEEFDVQTPTTSSTVSPTHGRIIITTALIEPEQPQRRRNTTSTAVQVPSSSSSASSETSSPEKKTAKGPVDSDDSIEPYVDENDRASLKTLTPPQSPSARDADRVSLKTITPESANEPPVRTTKTAVNRPIRAPQQQVRPVSCLDNPPYYFWPIVPRYRFVEPRVRISTPPTIIVTDADNDTPPRRLHQPEQGRKRHTPIYENV